MNQDNFFEEYIKMMIHREIELEKYEYKMNHLDEMFKSSVTSIAIGYESQATGNCSIAIG